MARVANKLKQRSVESAKKPGLYSDGDGLYLRVSVAGSKTWYFRYKHEGTPKAITLGPWPTLSLSDARKRASDQRKLLVDKKDPLKVRDDQKADSITFDKCAELYIEGKRGEWKNAKHATQWENTLRKYASPVFRNLPVKAIDSDLVIEVLKPIWSVKTETASRVRNRIELILDWAASPTRKYRSGDNPARWRGNLEHEFSKRSKVQPVEHHKALAFAEMPEFIEKLHVQHGIAPRALEFLILTATRTGEVLGARWTEINGDVWTIPASRMKAKREHRVPLSPRAMEILDLVRQESVGQFVFPCPKRGEERQLSNNALLALLKRMEVDVTAHGFRSTFRDWTAERTRFPREVAETALAHVLKDKTEAAYRRDDFLEKRRELMDVWDAYCTQPPASVTHIGARVKA